MQRWAAAVVTIALFLTVFAAATPASTARTPASASVAPGAVLDQNNAYREPPCSARSWRPTDPTAWMAQTFTPMVSGALTDVVLRLEGTAQTVNVALTTVDGTGRPVAT